jgi:methionyl-tRNA formyltransferase
MGERVTGGTVFWLTDQVDAGDIAAQDYCLIRPGETAGALWRRALFPLGLTLLARVLRDLTAGRVVRVAQDPALATWEPGWSRPPLGRPELPLLGDGRAHRYQVTVEPAGV